MNQLGTVYATKRRRRNGKSLKPPPKDGVTKSNPSKRHRERLNSELDMLASLLPYEQNILSKLDRLSILRLSVSYLRTKSYFQVVMHKDKDDGHLHHDAMQFRNRDMSAYDHTLLDGDMFLQALNGFLLILTCEGEVFFATHSIESYLGFHQSDIVHQSVYELVHSEDREELQRQLMWNSFLPAESSNSNVQEVLHADNCHLLERSFTVRFRCLLDNTSGFLRLDIRGRIKVLHGQNRKTEEAPLALFAICTPFGPPSLLEIPQKEVMFKSKHKLDLTLVSMDQRGKMLLGYSDSELANLGGYDLVHFEDLAYVASAHQELLKTGASGMIAYRFQTKDGQWQWLQTSSRLVYKNSKPDFVISTHRPLMEEEGRDLLGKRTMDFKVSYLDAGLNNSYFTDSDQLVGSNTHHPTPSASHHAASTTAAPQRVNRRYKTQLRDFLSTCRTKRKLAHNASTAAPIASNIAAVDYISATDTSSVAAAAVAAAYSNLNTMYTTPYQTTAVTNQPDNGLTYMGHSGNFHQSLYPAAAALDNRFLAATTENLFHQYRPLGTYYPDYHHAASQAPYVSNGFLDISPRGATCSLPTYDTPTSTHHHMHHQMNKQPDDKLYSCQQLVDTTKYDERIYNKCLDVSSPYSISPVPIQPIVMTSIIGDIGHAKKASSKHSPSMDGLSTSNSSSPTTNTNGLVTPKMEDIKSEVMMQNEHHMMQQQHYSPPASGNDNTPRQTVLMWGSGGTTTLNSNSRSPPSNSSNPGTPAVTNGTPTSYHQESSPGKKYNGVTDPLKSLADMNTMEANCKWSGKDPTSSPASPTAKSYHHHHLAHHHHQHLGAAYGGGGGGEGGGGEVWHQYHQYYPYTTQYHHAHTPHGSVGDNAYPQISRTGVLCCPSLR